MRSYTFLSLATAVSIGFAVGASAPSQAFSPQTPLSSMQTPLFVTVADDALSRGAEAFVETTANRGIGFLSNPALSEVQKKKEFDRLLKSSFDMRTIGRFALGRYWKTASSAQRDEYQRLFEKMVLDVYSSRFGEYSGQTLEVRGSRKDSEKDVTVNSFVLDQNGIEIQVDWRVRKKKGSYKVVDIVVEGVSMGVTQRSDFASVIQRGGGEMGVLLAHLRGQ